MQGIQYLSLQEADVGKLLEPMKRAYEANVDDYFDQTRSAKKPCYEDAELINKLDLGNPNTLAFKVCLNDQLIGAFIIRWHEHDESELSHLFIDPKFHRKGIGAQIWQFLKSCYPTQGWRTKAPLWLASAHRFYIEQCGFEQVEDSNGNAVFVWKNNETHLIESTSSHSELFPA